VNKGAVTDVLSYCSRTSMRTSPTVFKVEEANKAAYEARAHARHTFPQVDSAHTMSIAAIPRCMSALVQIAVHA